jgi:phenylacetate-CoA ligase
MEDGATVSERLLPSAAYERLRAAQLADVQAALVDHVARLNWSRDQIDRYRTHRLRALLGCALERSPFHARRLQGLDPNTATVADLSSLPIMTKQDAQAEWDSIVTSRYLTRKRAERILAEQQWFSYTPEDQMVFSSGGSSGVRGVYVWDWQFYVSAACLAWRMQAREEQHGSPQAPTRLAVLEAGTPPHASTPLFDVPTATGMETVARATLAGELMLRPVRVSTNSEPLLDEDRAAIRDAWNVPVHNLWGSTEIGVQAVGCGRGDGLHVCEDEVVLERVDEDGLPVGADEPAARTLATGLTNRTFPFIRYELGDSVEWLADKCPCGSAYMRVADIGGRRDDDFRYGPTTIPAGAFRHVLGTDPRVSEYQVTQTASGAEISVVGGPDVDALTSSVVAALRRYGLSAPEIRIRVVDRISRHEATGKLRRFIALRPPRNG